MLFKALKLLCTIIITILLYLYIWYSEQGELPGVQVVYQQMFLFIITGVAAGQGVFWLNRLFRKTNIRTTSSVVLLVVSVLSLLLTVSLFALMFVVSQQVNFYYFPIQTSHYYYPELLIKVGLLLFVVVVAYNVVYFVLFAYNEYGTSKVRQAVNDRQLLEAQLDLLRAQLSPHYLFNCLNTISSLLLKGSTQAELFIRQLALTFQYIFKKQNETLVLVHEEVVFVKAYYYLLQVRFDGQVQLNLQLDQATLQGHIPPLSLQLLVENAVKHNRPTKNEPLIISISQQHAGYIAVTNNIQLAAVPPESFRIGLENLKMRYSYLTSQQVKTTKDNNFQVEIPVLKSTA